MSTFLLFSRRVLALIGLLLVALVAGAFAPPAGADEDARRHKLFMPLAAGSKRNPPPPPPPLNCDVPGTSYMSLSVIGDSLTVNPDTDPNLNLGYRGYKRVDAPLKLVELGPVWDPKAPQLPGMFGDRRTPRFTNTYQRYNWDASCNCRGDAESRWDATVLGMGVARGETIYTPDSGYDIQDGYEYLVLYAGESDLTLHVGREDEFFGYVVHIDGVCTDPDLLALYRQRHAEGRRYLPALRGHQPFGVALDGEIQVAVRDTGSFMDPRSRNDWWQGR